MKKTTSVALMATGAAMLAFGAMNYQKRYTNEAIWQRQTPAISTHMRTPETRKLAYDVLRAGLEKAPEGDRVKRCKLEMDFATLIANDMRPGAIRTMVETRSFEPYAECKAQGELTHEAKNGTNIAGAATLLLGLYGFVRSFFRKGNPN